MGVIPILVAAIVGALLGAVAVARPAPRRRRSFSAILDSVEGPDGTIYYRGTYVEAPADDDELLPEGEPPAV